MPGKGRQLNHMNKACSLWCSQLSKGELKGLLLRVTHQGIPQFIINTKFNNINSSINMHLANTAFPFLQLN